MAGDAPGDIICEGDVCRRVTPEEAAASAAAPAGDGPEVFKLLGALQGKDGKEVPLSAITGKDKVIALYFSAHWCPPCRGFTPELARTYTRFKASHARAADWEIVFVSSDRDQKSFDEYFAEMPWLALPFDRRDAKAALSALYKVRGIPSLIVLDGETGEVITEDGRSALDDDAECANFPWRPKSFAETMTGVPLTPAPGSSEPVPDALAALQGKTTLLYFSASWCPPCRRFTPMLTACMAKLRAAGKNVQAVFVSGDRDEASFKDYHGHMTWPALNPVTQRDVISALNRTYQVEGIPTLVVLDEQGQVITRDGRAAVSTDPEGAKFPWRPAPWDQLSELTAGNINESRVVLLAVDEGDKAAAEALAGGILAATATEVKTGPEAAKWAFLWAQRSDDLAQRVLDFAGASAASPSGHLLMLLDVPGTQRTWDLTGKYELTPAGIKQLVGDTKAGRLGPGRSLGGDDQ